MNSTMGHTEAMLVLCDSPSMASCSLSKHLSTTYLCPTTASRNDLCVTYARINITILQQRFPCAIT